MFKIVVTITTILLLSAPQVRAASTDEVIEAFTNNQDVQCEIKAIREQHKGAKEEIQVVPLGGCCGVRGCSFIDLVVMRFRTRGANPRTYTVLAKVGGFSGKIKSITLMKLEPKYSPSSSKKLDGYSFLGRR